MDNDLTQETVNLTELAAMVQAGMVRAQRHPELPLTIYKYTQQAVYTRTWNEVTLRCRGVVLDDEGAVVVNGFPKFFNHSEPDGIPVFEANKDKPYTLTEKMDGSLIQAAMWKGHRIVTSSGSFTSEQAAEGRKMLEGIELDADLTYLFEIIYPGNRIVLDYGQRRSLVLLAVRDTATGEELTLDPRFECVQPGPALAVALADLDRAEFIQKEGYVVRWENGQRVKLKYAEYMRLHKIVSGVNEKFVWEALRDGVDLEASLAGVPDELLDFVRKTAKELRQEFVRIEKDAIWVHSLSRNGVTRKEQAEIIMRHSKHLIPLAFSMLDGKDYAPKLWKILEPETKPVREEA